MSVWLDLRLTAEGVSVMRGGMAVLQGVSFSVGPGQVLVLRGPNGIGKTSLLRMLAGIQPCLAGKLTASPEDLTYAAHADGLKSVLTAKENLQFWAAVHGQAGVEAALAAMDMAHLAGQRAGELSAGQKRRLGLARLLVTGRWLWLLDEPTVGLDTASTARFLAVLRSHLGQGGAAIIATHIDLGLPEARLLDLTEFRAQPSTAPTGGFDEAFT